MAEELRLGRAGEAIKGGLLRFLEGGAPIRRGLAGLLQGDVEPLKQAVGYGQPFPQLTPEQMRQQAFDVALDINNPMQNVGGLLGITAWHGSPHKFAPTTKNPLGEFDLNKMGSGEGAQAYGYGSYLAESKGVAEEYKKALSDWKPRNEVIKPGSPEEQAAAWLADALDSQSSNPYFMAEKNAKQSLPKNQYDEIVKVFNRWQESNTPFDKGYLYKVDLPDEYLPKMLDWDKPLSEQSPEVKNLASNLAKQTNAWNNYFPQLNPKAKKLASEMIEGKKPMVGSESAKYWKQLDKLNPTVDHNALFDSFYDAGLRSGQSDITGSRLYNNLTKKLGNAPMASDYLKDIGFSGIKYLDQGSRDAAQGTSNFVVFDPSILNILERQ